MRNRKALIKKLWANATNPLNEDRFFDMYCFMTHVIDGEITREEFNEVKNYDEPITTIRNAK